MIASLHAARACSSCIIDRLSRAGPRGKARGRTILGVHPLSWLLSNNRLKEVPFVSVPHTSSNRMLLRNQDKRCTPSVAHSLALPLGPALHNLCINCSSNVIFSTGPPTLNSPVTIFRLVKEGHFNMNSVLVRSGISVGKSLLLLIQTLMSPINFSHPCVLNQRSG